MKKRILIILGILIAAGAVGAGVWYYYRGSIQPTGSGTVTYVSSIEELTGTTSGVMNRFAGVVEPQETVKVEIERGRKVKEVRVKEGEEVKKGQLLFEYDLSSIQEDLQQAQLDLDRLKNEAVSLQEQIKTLTKEKKKAKSSDQLSYTIEIETNNMSLKKNEYDQKSKTAEIERLQSATGNTEVRSELDGVIQKIDTSKMTSDDGDVVDEGISYMYGNSDEQNNAFITILSTGAYRIKGKVNEMNQVTPGEPVIIRSRVDNSLTWRGTMGEVDLQNGSSDDSSGMYWGMSTSDEQTNSTSYPFYVELESSEGLMLGQHVYIERDLGQADVKEGLWLSEYYIVDADTENPFVWAANEKNRLEKRPVILGRHDEDLGEYEIVEGLTKEDYIAFPTELLEEGNVTEVGDITQMMGADADPEMYDQSLMGDDEMQQYDGEFIDMTGGEMIGEDGMSDEYTEDFQDDFSDGDELVPMDSAPGMESETSEMEGEMSGSASMEGLG